MTLGIIQPRLASSYPAVTHIMDLILDHYNDLGNLKHRSLVCSNNKSVSRVVTVTSRAFCV